jgi:hypothetical protein
LKKRDLQYLIHKIGMCPDEEKSEHQDKPQQPHPGKGYNKAPTPPNKSIFSKDRNHNFHLWAVNFLIVADNQMGR